MAKIKAYDAIDQYLARNRMSPSALARAAGVDERDFRRIMQLRSDKRRYSALFVEKLHAATHGEVDRSLWIPS